MSQQHNDEMHPSCGGALSTLCQVTRRSRLILVVRRQTEFSVHAVSRNPRGMKVLVVDGDLLDQDVDVIVNAWNRNIIPWWLLIPQGVSGAIKKLGGLQPFRELGRFGPIPLGHAVETSAGTLPFKSIIHVAGINMLWRSSDRSIRDSVRNAIAIAKERGYKSLALPLIGAGSGGGKSAKVQSIIEDELSLCQFDGEVRIVRYAKLSTHKTLNTECG